MKRNFTAAELKLAATGRWLDILLSAGLPAELLDGHGHPCPKCGGNDRFAAWPDINSRGAVHCRGCFAAGGNPAPSDGLSTLQWLLGCTFPDAIRWLADYLGHEAVTVRPRPVVRSVTVTGDTEAVPERIGRIDKQSRQSMKPDWWQNLSGQLSIPIPALKRMRVGWASAYGCWTFPMCNAAGDVIGIRLRKPTGEKRSVTGSKAGLFIPDGIGEAPRRLFIAEGPTDTAALVSLGLDAIGRPSCAGSKQTTVAYVRRMMPAETIVVADNDQPGIDGADSLASELLRVTPVRVMIPPAKDCRQWLIDGCCADDIVTAASAVDARTLGIVSEVRA